MSYLSAHVLDAAAGRPAAGVRVTLIDTDDAVLASALTNDDGRVADLGPDRLDAGTYRVTFATGEYFAGRDVECFYPDVTVHFQTAADQGHYHIPLLLSPYSYTTYRGS
ncbi:MAG: hydroxyisourate hydrolase [Propionibacteriaceae bacterium]